MLVFNQDRDEIVEVDLITVKKHYYEGKFFGYNLMGYDKEKEYLLGTFDSDVEAYSEMIQLHQDKNPIKHVTIYWQFANNVILYIYNSFIELSF